MNNSQLLKLNVAAILAATVILWSIRDQTQSVISYIWGTVQTISPNGFAESLVFVAIVSVIAMMFFSLPVGPGKR